MVDATSKISNSNISNDARIYKNVIIRDSSIGSKCIVGDMCHVDKSVMEHFTQLYPFGTFNSSHIGPYSYIQKNCSVWHATIGSYCSISWNVSIGGGEHDFHRVTAHSMLYATPYGFVDTPLYERFSENCKIGNDVWIAAGATILRGVTIGDGAVIGAGAVVTKSVEPYSIVAGVPAKKIGQRCSDELVSDLLEIKWWKWPDNIIKQNIKLFNQELNKETIDQLAAIAKEIKLEE